MSLASLVAEARAAAENEIGSFRHFIDEHLPAIETAAGDVEKALASPITQAVMAAAHIDPELEQTIADLIAKAEQKLAGFAAAEPEAPPADEPPAE